LFFIFGAGLRGRRHQPAGAAHPINSALSLIVVMGSLALIYLLLGAEFVAAVQVIVYAGAIMVLFVFVIMLLNAGEEEHCPWQPRRHHASAVPPDHRPGAFRCLGRQPSSGLDRIAIGRGHEWRECLWQSQAVGHLLFRKYLLPFEVTSILILVAIMGAVVLARREE
jgi:NADH-quinone oxidoreductase subunit J